MGFVVVAQTAVEATWSLIKIHLYEVYRSWYWSQDLIILHAKYFSSGDVEVLQDSASLNQSEAI